MNRDFFTSPTGQVVLVVAVLVIGVVTVRWQNSKRTLSPLPAATTKPAVVLPKTVTRDGQRYEAPTPLAAERPVPSQSSAVAPVVRRSASPLGLYSASVDTRATAPRSPIAPFGRLIPCETVVALESNRLETPVIGLVTEDVWHDGKLVIPAGAEVHAKAALDPSRERLAVTGSWRIVWRTPDARNGAELSVSGLALDREREANGEWGAHDGSAGLRGQVVKVTNDRELKLFAATFLGAAASALQDTRLTAGVLGETTLPATTARNAALTGTSSVLREYAQAMREAIARDGLFVRVPAGKPFYLYVTETIDLTGIDRLVATQARP